MSEGLFPKKLQRFSLTDVLGCENPLNQQSAYHEWDSQKQTTAIFQKLQGC
jgi:hypothetical protein